MIFMFHNIHRKNWWIPTTLWKHYLQCIKIALFVTKLFHSIDISYITLQRYSQQHQLRKSRSLLKIFLYLLSCPLHYLGYRVDIPVDAEYALSFVTLLDFWSSYPITAVYWLLRYRKLKHFKWLVWFEWVNEGMRWYLTDCVIQGAMDFSRKFEIILWIYFQFHNFYYRFIKRWKNIWVIFILCTFDQISIGFYSFENNYWD